MFKALFTLTIVAVGAIAIFIEFSPLIHAVFAGLTLP